MRLLLRVREAADALSISERQVWTLIRAGKLTPIRPQGLRMIRLAPEQVAALANNWKQAAQGCAESR
jgi:excisionase family DNA binding protein